MDAYIGYPDNFVRAGEFANSRSPALAELSSSFKTALAGVFSLPCEPCATLNFVRKELCTSYKN